MREGEKYVDLAIALAIIGSVLYILFPHTLNTWYYKLPVAMGVFGLSLYGFKLLFDEAFDKALNEEQEPSKLDVGFILFVMIFNIAIIFIAILQRNYTALGTYAFLLALAIVPFLILPPPKPKNQAQNNQQ